MHFGLSRNVTNVLFPIFLLLSLSASDCNSSSSSGGGSDLANTGCSGSCANTSLTAEDVDRILRQAVSGAQLIESSATIAVTDRVGNVLGVYAMDGAAESTQIGNTVGGGLEGVIVPSTFAAISKAGTSAFLSSQGNAFGTRTLGQLIQENFNPGENLNPSGPIFGVQFSQLVCSDVPNLNPEVAAGLTVTPGTTLASGLVGPRPLPLGLAADTGGIPIYKNGDLVGGIGVELNGNYAFDPVITDLDDDPEERIALTGTVDGFEVPSERAANEIFALGNALRLTDISYSDLNPLPSPLPELNPNNIIAVPGFFGGQLLGGAQFGQPSSGLAAGTKGEFAVADLVDENGNLRFPTTGGSNQGGVELKASEVDALLLSALNTASRARSGLRLPDGSQVQASVWVVDINGAPLGFTHTFDAPIFGIDVALQKARTAAFFSSTDAGSRLNDTGFGSYLSASNDLLGENAFSAGTAFSSRAIGEIARPFFPDGSNGNANGPLSLPFSDWSPFNTGLQFDVISDQYRAPLNGQFTNGCSPAFGERLQNGVQIFPGSVPLYRDGTLIGGIGISGDGIDQDDLVAFFSSSREGLDAIGETAIGDPVLGFNAPQEIRADTLELNFPNTRLRYVNCPEAPFRGSRVSNSCTELFTNSTEGSEAADEEQTTEVTEEVAGEVIPETIVEEPDSSTESETETTTEQATGPSVFSRYTCNFVNSLTPVGGEENLQSGTFDIVSAAFGQPHIGTAVGGFDIASDGTVTPTQEASFPVTILIDENRNASGTFGGTQLNGAINENEVLIVFGSQNFQFNGNFEQRLRLNCSGDASSTVF